MLRRLSLKDFVIVSELEIDWGAHFCALTGETGAGKSILIDALQLALGNRADAAAVREGAARAEICAEFDTPPSLRAWLEEAGFPVDDSLLLRRVIDAQGKSRAWVNGSAATLAQLREAADQLVDIHGQHAWQSLTRPAAVRALLDEQAGIDTAALEQAFAQWRSAVAALDDARTRQHSLEQERERLQWQISELDKLAPAEGEWETLDAEHRRLANAQSLLDAAQRALQALSESEPSALGLQAQAQVALADVAALDPELAAVAGVLSEAQALIDDAAHSLQAYLGHREPDPERLAALDARLAAWIGLARRYRRPPADLPALLAGWRGELRTLEAAADLQALQSAVETALEHWTSLARQVSQRRHSAAPQLAKAVTRAMQGLGMAGGRFEVALLPQDQPQAYGAESAEFRVAGHAGSTPRPLAKVASGGELSRLALAIAATAAQERSKASTLASHSGRASAVRDGAAPATLIFDEIDAGVGGDVANAVGRLMKQLGAATQVLAVTHLAQVAACADDHYVVAKQGRAGVTHSSVSAVTGEARVAEIARMLGGAHLGATSRAHAQALLEERR
ncbi:MAG: DNA repair protein RecN [Rubrivivax sp.]|nr:DNA repair protein RecN [Rubrivivax sp.]